MRIPIFRPLTPDQWRQQQTWQYRTIAYLQDHKSTWNEFRRLILLGVLGQTPRRLPYLVGASHIDKEGQWRCLMRFSGFNVFTGEAEVTEQSARLGTVEEVRNMFRRLADETKLDDADRIAMFDELRKWVARDERATSEEGRQDGKVFK